MTTIRKLMMHTFPHNRVGTQSVKLSTEVLRLLAKATQADDNYRYTKETGNTKAVDKAAGACLRVDRMLLDEFKLWYRTEHLGGKA